MDTHAEILARWPRLTDLANDTKERLGTVWAWRDRDSIPAPYWAGVVRSAEKHGITGVTFELLARSAARKKQKKRAA